MFSKRYLTIGSSILAMLGTLAKCAPDVVGVPGMINDAQKWQEWLSLLTFGDYVWATFFFICTGTLFWAVFSDCFSDNRPKRPGKRFVKAVCQQPELGFVLPIVYVKNTESQEYAQLLEGAINTSGLWEACAEPYKYDQSLALSGIKVSVPYVNNNPKEADFVAASLERAGIKFDWWQDNYQKTPVRVIVALRY